MRIRSLTAAAVTALLLSTGLAHADGTHGVKIKITSEVPRNIEIGAYNAKDTMMTIPHKVYYLKDGDDRNVKCHGQGKGFCQITVKMKGTGNYLFFGSIKDKSDCTISNTEGTFHWGGSDSEARKKNGANMICK